MADREQRRSDEERLSRNRAWIEWLAREQHLGLRAVALRHGIAAQDVDDVIQTALANVLRAFPGPDERNAAFSYAARAVQNTALKAHRRAQRKESHNVAIGAERPEREEPRGVVHALFDRSQGDPLERAIEREAATELGARLAALPSEQRTALALSAAGYGVAEIAEALGLSERATRKRIERGNRALREDAR